MSSNLLKIDDEYRSWIQEISRRYHQSQIKAAYKVNDEMLRFYWSLGRDISVKQKNAAYGSRFYQSVSADLRELFPDSHSFSVTNLKYMRYYYEMYSGVESCAQVESGITENQNRQQLEDDLSNSGNRQQLVDDLSDHNDQIIFSIPWGHQTLLIDKCKGDPKKALFYTRKTIENNWSRAVLSNFLETDLYERQGKAITNFAMTLPAPQSDLAQAITRDPYSFDFLMIREKYDETELKDALMNNITRFLLELGNGFSFVGREYRLEIGNTENFIDMLFYNIKLHCYVVVEVKVKEFEASDMGQLGTYMVAVNHQLKGELENPTLGLLICRSKDNVKAQYALEASSQPMGISQYDIHTFLPEDYRGTMPTIEEIEAELAISVKEDDQ